MLEKLNNRFSFVLDTLGNLIITTACNQLIAQGSYRKAKTLHKFYFILKSIWSFILQLANKNTRKSTREILTLRVECLLRAGCLRGVELVTKIYSLS